jgi:predicted enzyme related to lactoylglutathione lyase
MPPNSTLSFPLRSNDYFAAAASFLSRQPSGPLAGPWMLAAWERAPESAGLSLTSGLLDSHIYGFPVLVTSETQKFMNMNVKAADFVFIVVTDLSESVSFYRDTLGLDLESMSDEGVYAEFALPPTTLSLGETNPQMPLMPGEGGTCIAMAVDDVETATKELHDEGVTVLMDPIETDVCYMSLVADPDGNQITLHNRKDGTYGRVDPFP